MDHRELRSALKATPFQPFRIRMADGRSFAIHHPDFLLISPNGGTVFAYDFTGEEMSILATSLLTEIEINQTATKAAA